MRSMVEGLALNPEQPLYHALARAVPLPVPGKELIRPGCGRSCRARARWP